MSDLDSKCNIRRLTFYDFTDFISELTECEEKFRKLGIKYNRELHIGNKQYVIIFKIWE